MRELFLQRPRLITSLMCGLCVYAVLTVQKYHLLEQVSFNWGLFSQPEATDTFGLGRYRVSIEARPLEGVVSDASALTYDPDRNTLFTVTNKNNELIELSLEGDVLRRIPLVGFGDTEAVEYIAPGQYVISDEYEQRLISVQVTDSTTMLDAERFDQLRLGIGAGNNNGFEGLAYDPANQRMFVAKERRPARIIEVRGFPVPRDASARKLEISANEDLNDRLFVRDLSSLLFVPNTGHLLALSDESLQIVELNEHGHPIDNIMLNKDSMGLTEDIPQPEGLAMDADGTLYVVSEPNLFYAFKKR